MFKLIDSNEKFTGIEIIRKYPGMAFITTEIEPLTTNGITITKGKLYAIADKTGYSELIDHAIQLGRKRITYILNDSELPQIHLRTGKEAYL